MNIEIVMDNLEKYKKYSENQIRWLIRALKFLRFFTTKKGEFALSFIFIVGFNIILFGPIFPLFVLLLVFHSIYFFFFSNILMNKFRMKEDYIEYTEEINTLTELLKEKIK